MSDRPNIYASDAAREAGLVALKQFPVLDGRVVRLHSDAVINAFLSKAIEGADEKLAEIRAALQDIEHGDWTIGLRSIHSRNGEQTIADHIPDTGTLRFLANSPRFVEDLITIVDAFCANLKEEQYKFSVALKCAAYWAEHHGEACNEIERLQAQLKERTEQCAKLADKMAETWRPVEVGFMGHQPNKRHRAGMRAAALELAALIRRLPSELS